jgi:hypothetical protein
MVIFFAAQNAQRLFHDLFKSLSSCREVKKQPTHEECGKANEDSKAVWKARYIHFYT